MIRTFVVAALAWLNFGASDPLSDQTIHITMQTAHYGPVEAIVEFDQRRGVLEGRSSSGAAAQVRAMIIDPRAASWRGDTLLRFRVRRTQGGAYAGDVSTPMGASAVAFRWSDDRLTGRIDSGPLAGELSGERHAGGDAPLRNYGAVVSGMDEVLPAMLFNPNLLESPAFRSYRQGLAQVAARARDDVDLLFAAELGWTDRTFSHFGLARQTSAEIAASVDADARPSAELRFDGDIAILRVNTFLGQNAIELINESIAMVRTRGAPSLIVDLRGTPGGSLAAKALIERLISGPMDLGWFSANAWWRTHDVAPTRNDAFATAPSDFSDPQAAFETLIQSGLLRVEARPGADVYSGRVFVLIDHETASVAELAAAALGGSERATLVGERTAGELLNADTLPLPEGFSLLTPLADYSDARVGRIEGVGVAPHIEVASSQALQRALELARRGAR